MPTYQDTKRGYTNLWNKATILPAHHAAAIAIARKIRSEPWASAFKEVEQATGVPDFLVGAFLERESSLRLDTYLGNGERLDRVTTLVPANRGPFLGPHAFLNGAIDALTAAGMVGVKNWYLPLMLFCAEKFNGFGYFNHAVNDPYVWSWTPLYTRGKFTKDGPGGWDPNFVDPQPGVAAILLALKEIDATVAARLIMDPSVTVAPGQPAAPTPAIPTPAPAPAPARPPAAPATPSIPTPPPAPPVKPEIPMPTTAATPVAIVDPIPQIIALLEIAKKYLPIVSGFIPAPIGGVVIAAVPIIEEILQLIEDAKTKSGVDLFQTIGAHIQSIGQHVQTTATTAGRVMIAAPVATAPPEGMPNAQ